MFVSTSTRLPENLTSLLCNDWVSIHCEASKTKVVFVLHDNANQRSVRYVRIKNSELKSCLEDIRSLSHSTSINKIFITGFNKVWAKTITELVFNLEIILVDDAMAVSRGVDLIMNHVKFEDLELEQDNMSEKIAEYKVDENNPFFKKMRETALKFQREIQTKVDENKINLPAIFIIADSFVNFYLVKEDKSAELINTIYNGIDNLTGLAKGLIDVNEFNKILSLADKGNRENTDTQVFEVISDVETSPYGKLPPTLPVFFFGKSVDYNKNREEFNKEDLMISLYSLISSTASGIAMLLCRQKKLTSMFVSTSTRLPENLTSLLCNDWVSIHCEASKTKVVFVLHDNANQMSVRYVRIKNSELKSCLEDIRSLSHSTSINKIFITGFNKVWAKTITELVFNLEIVLVDDTIAISRGVDLIMNHIKFEDLELKQDDMSEKIAEYKLDENNPILKKIRETALKFQSEIQTKVDENKINLPAIFIIADSFVNFYLVKEDKSAELINTIYNGIDNLTGLAKCLIDVNEFNKILSLADKGNRENTDTQVFEVIPDVETSPYGKLPPTLPLFFFGKSVDYNKSNEEFNKEDLMISLCSLISSTASGITMLLCRQKKLTSVYLCGALFENPVFSKALLIQSKIFQSSISLKIIKCDYIQAIGSMKI